MLVDSGSDEHVCMRTWHEEADFDLSKRGGGGLRDVQVWECLKKEGDH